MFRIVSRGLVDLFLACKRGGDSMILFIINVLDNIVSVLSSASVIAVLVLFLAYIFRAIFSVVTVSNPHNLALAILSAIWILFLAYILKLIKQIQDK
jgi:hypothetical protein